MTKCSPDWGADGLTPCHRAYCRGRVFPDSTTHENAGARPRLLRRPTTLGRAVSISAAIAYPARGVTPGCRVRLRYNFLCVGYTFLLRCRRLVCAYHWSKKPRSARPCRKSAQPEMAGDARPADRRDHYHVQARLRRLSGCGPGCPSNCGSLAAFVSSMPWAPS